MPSFMIVMAVARSAAAASPLFLSSLPAPPGTHAAPATDDAAKALDDAVLAYARGSFAVEEARHFVLAEKLGWQQVISPVANRIEAAGGVSIPIPWNRPGYDLIELFRLQDGCGLAVAMDYAQAPARSHVVGYYRITLTGAK